MKTIGLLGGMSWESSAHYYRAINDGIRSALGNLHSAKIAIPSKSCNTWETGRARRAYFRKPPGT